MRYKLKIRELLKYYKGQSLAYWFWAIAAALIIVIGFKGWEKGLQNWQYVIGLGGFIWIFGGIALRIMEIRKKKIDRANLAGSK